MGPAARRDGGRRSAPDRRGAGALADLLYSLDVRTGRTIVNDDIAICTHAWRQALAGEGG